MPIPEQAKKVNVMVQHTSNDSMYFGSIQAYGDPSRGVLHHKLA